MGLSSTFFGKTYRIDRKLNAGAADTLPWQSNGHERT